MSLRGAACLDCALTPFSSAVACWRQVVCGRFHTICVTAQSAVFAWGANSAGQLGLGDRRDRSSPTLVDSLWALPVSRLAGPGVQAREPALPAAWGASCAVRLLLPKQRTASTL